MPRDLDAHVLFHPTYLTDRGFPTGPPAELYGLLAEQVWFRLDRHIEHPNPDEENDWLCRADSAKGKWSPCSTWTGPVRSGWPRIYLPIGTKPAHRVMWELTKHPVPDGYVARPRCSHNKLCLTADHLALYVARACHGKLSYREKADLVALCISGFQDAGPDKEWSVMAHYGQVFGIRTQTVRFHVQAAGTYHDYRRKRYEPDPPPKRRAQKPYVIHGTK